MDHARRWLAIALLFCAAGAEVPRQVLIRAHGLAMGGPAPVAAHHPAHETAQAAGAGDSHAAHSPGAEQSPLTSDPARGGDSYWFFEASAEGAAVVPRRDRVLAPTYDGWANELCCAAGEDRGPDGSHPGARSDCHNTGSAVVVACRLIPLRN